MIYMMIHNYMHPLLSAGNMQLIYSKISKPEREIKLCGGSAIRNKL